MKKIYAVILMAMLSLSLALTVMGCNDKQSTVTQNIKTATSTEKTTAAKTSESDEAEKGFDWKALLAKEEVSAILGLPLAPPEYKDTKNPLGQRIIFWSAEDATKLSYVQLSLITTGGMKQQLRDSGHNAKKQFDTEKQFLKDTKDVDGIGDEAYWDASSPLISGLHVLKGDYCFTVMVNSKDKNSQLQAEKTQALKVLERLP